MFDVRPSALHEGAGQLRADGDDITAAGAQGAGGASSASGSAGAGPLAGALSSYAGRLRTRSSEMAEVTRYLGDAMDASAATYTGSDSAASGALGVCLPP